MKKVNKTFWFLSKNKIRTIKSVDQNLQVLCLENNTHILTTVK
jgi:hypothetical protein